MPNLESTIPETDRTIITETLLEQNEDATQNTIDDFIWKISLRLYTEFCLTTYRSKHSAYEGEAYAQWVADETHFALEREFTGRQPTHEIYLQTREKVVAALAKRAIRLFSDWEGNSSPRGAKKDDMRNLRASLAEYLV